MAPVEFALQVLPSSIVARNMWGFSTKMFERNMFGKQNLASFWSAAHHSGFAQEHPHATRMCWNRAIPFCIHGDGARAFKQQKILILSWNPTLVRGCSWDTRFLYAVLPWELLIPGVTLRQLLTAFCDDVNDLQRGSHSGPWRFAFFGSKGDLEWMQEAYSLKHYYRCNLLCHRCFASQSHKDIDLLFTNLSEDAGWLSTMISTLMFLQNALKHRPLPPLCQVDGWSAQSMLWDSMHNIFLGIGQDILGSGLQLLCSIKYFGDFSTQEQLKVAHRALREF